MTAYDDLGAAVRAGAKRRVVSLVPSLTEAIAATREESLAGATDWCTHPAGLGVPRVRGTKNPDLKAIVALRPDLVIANQEENRQLDVHRLREAGVDVWVTRIQTVPEAFASMRRMFTEGLGWDEPAWLTEAEQRWTTRRDKRMDIAVAVWRDPWMVVGSDTFTGDLLERLGCVNVFKGHPERYPRLDLAEIDRPGVTVLLPDEPYVFTENDGPEAFERADTRLVNGRLITWYGPSLLEAADLSWS